MYRSFLPVLPDEVRTRPETTPPRPKSMRGRVLFTVVILLGAVGVIQLLNLMDVSSPCTEAQQAALDSLDHFVAELPERPEVPGCSVTFRTIADPEEVLDHYQTVLTAQGWTILPRQDPRRPATATPIPFDGPPPATESGIGGSLEALRDGLEIAVFHEVDWELDPDADEWALTGTVYVLLTDVE